MNALIDALERFALDRPRLLLAVVLAVCLGIGAFATQVRLDASGDSLLLQQDPDLRFYRGMRARYGSDDYLLVTYAPVDDLFADPSLERLGALRDELAAVAAVEAVTTILDVPLVASPPRSLKELQQQVPTLLSATTDRQLARAELTQGALYGELLVSSDGRTTALLISLRRDADYEALLTARDKLREQGLAAELDKSQAIELSGLERDIRVRRDAVVAGQSAGIDSIRDILQDYRSDARIVLGGVPMIVADMLDFIVSDIIVFGTGILLFLILLLATIFVRP
ncbi:MAG: hypothetical protein ACR2QB_12095, partial [Gammaproteobacteria bacterium]